MALLAVGAAASFAYAFFLRDPELRIYRFGQAIDNSIVDAELLLGIGREDFLNLLQRDVGDLIRIGADYEPALNIDRELGHFRESLGHLRDYVQEAVPLMEAVHNDADFGALRQRAQRLRRHRELADIFIGQQESRVLLLGSLNVAMVELYGLLSDFEGMFYETDPWVTLPYVQAVIQQFERIEGIHREYMEAVEAYARTKARFYLAIRGERS